MGRAGYWRGTQAFHALIRDCVTRDGNDSGSNVLWIHLLASCRYFPHIHLQFRISPVLKSSSLGHVSGQRTEDQPGSQQEPELSSEDSNEESLMKGLLERCEQEISKGNSKATRGTLHFLGQVLAVSQLSQPPTLAPTCLHFLQVLVIRLPSQGRTVTAVHHHFFPPPPYPNII